MEAVSVNQDLAERDVCLVLRDRRVKEGLAQGVKPVCRMKSSAITSVCVREELLKMEVVRLALKVRGLLVGAVLLVLLEPGMTLVIRMPV
jgi:hypothetical protein